MIPNTPKNTLSHNVLILWQFISVRNKRRFLVICIMTVVHALFEAASLGSLLPFLTAITSPELLMENAYVVALTRQLGVVEKEQLVLLTTITFISIVVLTALFRFLILHAQYRFAHNCADDLSERLFDQVLAQDFGEISRINSSEIVSVITIKINQLINSVIVPQLLLLSSVFISAVLIGGLMLVDWKLTLSVSSIIFIIYAGWLRRIKRRLSQNSSIISTELNSLVKVIQESLGGIREIILGNLAQSVNDRFAKAGRRLRSSLADVLFLAAAPRIVLEMSLIVVVASLAYFLFYTRGSIVSAIPTLGLLAYVAQRLLPAAQQMYANIATIQGCKELVDDIAVMLIEHPKTNCANSAMVENIPDTNDVASTNLGFETSIVFENVGYSYDVAEGPVLKNVSFEIRKGQRIGIFGRTGSGKSTLLDLILGLLKPTNGKILIDNKDRSTFSNQEWYSIVSSVPQSIFLADTTILRNIAGLESVEEISSELAIHCAKLAQIYDDINSFADGFDTNVGERGVRLSGGQLQRIGVARGLYKQSQLLVLDEVTSSVDKSVEKQLELSLKTLPEELTIIKVAHRIETLRECDNIFELQNGRIEKSGTYPSFFGDHNF